MCDILETSRARWGVSGALYLKSAIAGSNTYLRSFYRRKGNRKVALMVWPDVMNICEPRQIRKEAAVNSFIHVPSVNWIGVNSLYVACDKRSKVGSTTF